MFLNLPNATRYICHVKKTGNVSVFVDFVIPAPFKRLTVGTWGPDNHAFLQAMTSAFIKAGIPLTHSLYDRPVTVRALNGNGLNGADGYRHLYPFMLNTIDPSVISIRFIPDLDNKGVEYDQSFDNDHVVIGPNDIVIGSTHCSDEVRRVRAYNPIDGDYNLAGRHSRLFGAILKRASNGDLLSADIDEADSIPASKRANLDDAVPQGIPPTVDIGNGALTKSVAFTRSLDTMLRCFAKLTYTPTPNTFIILGSEVVEDTAVVLSEGRTISRFLASILTAVDTDRFPNDLGDGQTVNTMYHCTANFLVSPYLDGSPRTILAEVVKRVIPDDLREALMQALPSTTPPVSQAALNHLLFSAKLKVFSSDTFNIKVREVPIDELFISTELHYSTLFIASDYTAGLCPPLLPTAFFLSEEAEYATAFEPEAEERTITITRNANLYGGLPVTMLFLNIYGNEAVTPASQNYRDLSVPLSTTTYVIPANTKAYLSIYGSAAFLAFSSVEITRPSDVIIDQTGAMAAEYAMVTGSGRFLYRAEYKGAGDGFYVKSTSDLDVVIRVALSGRQIGASLYEGQGSVNLLTDKRSVYDTYMGKMSLIDSHEYQIKIYRIDGGHIEPGTQFTVEIIAS